MSDLAVSYSRDVLEVAKLYSAFNENLSIYWLHIGAEDLRVQGRWQAAARGNLRDEIYRIRRELAAKLLKSDSKKDVTELVTEWLTSREAKVERYKSMLAEMRLRNAVDFASLSVAAQELRDLIDD
jgi:glutamate dehydrogenase